MPHFESIVKSQKISWIRRLIDARVTNWKAIAWKQIGISQQILLSKYSLEFIKQPVSPFYSQVLRFWYDIYATEPCKLFIREEKLNYNKYILINNRPICNETWQNHGLCKLKDLYKQTGSILSRNELNHKYGLSVKCMTYNSLMHAIPDKWKKAMMEDFRIGVMGMEDVKEIILGDKSYDIEELTSGTLYWHLMAVITKQPTSIEHWISEFPFLNDNDFRHFFVLPYAIVKDTKLQTFQYAILNQIIPTGAKLHTWKMVESDKCQYCNRNEYDNISHYFYTCEKTSFFWNQIIKWVSFHFKMQIPLSKTDIIFGITPTKETMFYSLNYLILHGKWYIYRCKLDNKNMFLYEFLTEFKHKLIVEKHMFAVKGELQKFTENLGILNDVLLDT